MKSRKIPLIVLIVGLILTFAGLLIPYCLLQINKPSFGIIGGAGLPTYYYLLTTMAGGIPFCMVLGGSTMSVTSLPALLFHKKLQQHCSLKTSGIALSLSAVGALGLACFLECYAIAAFHEYSKHPIVYLLGIITTLISLCIFALLCVRYIRARTERKSIAGTIIDILTSILYLPAFLFCVSYLIQFLRC